jgi:hypothetical protein
MVLAQWSRYTSPPRDAERDESVLGPPLQTSSLMTQNAGWNGLSLVIPLGIKQTEFRCM